MCGGSPSGMLFPPSLGPRVLYTLRFWDSSLPLFPDTTTRCHEEEGIVLEGASQHGSQVERGGGGLRLFFGGAGLFD